MRTTSILTRCGLTVAAAVLPPAVVAPAALAATSVELNVTSSGSLVRATTTACPNAGNASLLSAGQANFAQGRQTPLNSGTAIWQNVSPGTYQVVVACSDGSTVGPTSVTVTRGTPTTSSTSTPIAGVRGGLGGAVHDVGPLTLAGGGALVAAGVTAGVWFLRRRAAGQRT
ncbi:hypothetical protein [Streptomyces beihaiensis]|uniref:Secreted protein n=1 Tax=Streptomyces beihaiensis TaxID=2984495 RepID=A0ABT3TXB9_9ACTN|nr:hypothetical protein [Streptomyces beihaiensis]MCX3061697.1 hypothetical protein [Streptomyces beihaiensis]